MKTKWIGKIIKNIKQQESQMTNKSRVIIKILLSVNRAGFSSRFHFLRCSPRCLKWTAEYRLYRSISTERKPREFNEAVDLSPILRWQWVSTSNYNLNLRKNIDNHFLTLVFWWQQQRNNICRWRVCGRFVTDWKRGLVILLKELSQIGE